MKGESEVEKKDQPCEDVMKSENKMSQEKKGLDSIKIGIGVDSAERLEKKGMVREEKGMKKNKKHVNFYA